MDFDGYCTTVRLFGRRGLLRQNLRQQYPPMARTMCLIPIQTSSAKTVARLLRILILTRNRLHGVPYGSCSEYGGGDSSAEIGGGRSNDPKMEDRDTDELGDLGWAGESWGRKSREDRDRRETRDCVRRRLGELD